MKIFNSNDSKLAKLGKQQDFRWFDVGELVGILFNILKKMKQPVVINGGSYSYAADIKKNPLLWKSSDGAVINVEYFSDIFGYLSDYIVEDILLCAVNDEVSSYIKSGKAPSQEEHEFENIREASVKYTRDSKVLRDKIVSFAKSIGFKINSSEKQARAYRIWMTGPNDLMIKIKKFLLANRFQPPTDSYNPYERDDVNVNIVGRDDGEPSEQLLITHWYATPTKLDRGVDATVSDKDYFGEIRREIRKVLREQRSSWKEQTDPFQRDTFYAILKQLGRAFTSGSLGVDDVEYIRYKPIIRGGKIASIHMIDVGDRLGGIDTHFSEDGAKEIGLTLENIVAFLRENGAQLIKQQRRKRTFGSYYD